MNSKTITIPNISCGHCVNTIRVEVNELAGVSAVDASAETKKVTVSWSEPATWNAIESLLVEINFPPASA